MKFGHEYAEALANEGFPLEWRESAIDYKFLKKCIKKVHSELEDLGLDADTIYRLSRPLSEPRPNHTAAHPREYYSAAWPSLDSIAEEFTPQLRVLVDSKTGLPLDATLSTETKESLRRLAQHEAVLAARQAHLGVHAVHEVHEDGHELSKERTVSLTPAVADAKWIEVPLSSAKDFFDLLAPKLDELDRLREAETRRLEEGILDLGEAVENLIQPVRDGFEAKREINYRDLYFWREIFRLYLENPIFYSPTEQKHGALSYSDGRTRLEAYDQQLRTTGLLTKLKTRQAKRVAQQFFELNLTILKTMHFQEMNAQAMRKILKKFGKRTHLASGSQPFLQVLQSKHPALLASTSKLGPAGFATSIARDLYAELATKVLSIVPQVDDWNCPVCTEMAWRPVNLGCCRSKFCIRCVIKLQDEGMAKCPTCNAETVMKANGGNIDWEAMMFLDKYFPVEVKRRQKDNERAILERRYGEQFTKPGCAVM